MLGSCDGLPTLLVSLISIVLPPRALCSRHQKVEDLEVDAALIGGTRAIYIG